ncbi:hypothetical protein KO481_02520 [Nocardia sp. NEAU-G5]|uniref:Uncharacterized protein n=1 Tax=Nocardia albiluteola TaxID=2842303 RepID=A0ABS6AQU7_9NOCA|nr:hypothetical protein [Nocardia albiluteola]MBU3060396.1 hypothetical protein [Nocardia albiluteola]
MRTRVCTSCDSALDHCHGTLIVHTDWSVDCTEGDNCYDGDRSRHSFIVDCFDVAGGCGCAVSGTRRRPRSLAG